MGFSESVSSRAMVACGRICCLCQKSCGLKMELHHIKQKVYEGSDDFENCIPLCFDCHADMGKGDPNHSKGKRYTEKELIERRDSWYEAVKKKNIGFSVETVFEEDRKLFKEICDIFTSDVIYWIKEADIGGYHPLDVFAGFSNMLRKMDDPFFEFRNSDVESLKGNLLESMKNFMLYKAVNTFPREIAGRSVGVTRQFISDSQFFSDEMRV